MQGQLVELLRQSGEICADCAAPLGGSSAAWASVSFGVFVCLECAGVHRNLGVQISRVKSVHMDTWNADEIELMKRNRANSASLEAHLPLGIKASVRQSNASRVVFIKAKYVSKTFTTTGGLQFRLPNGDNSQTISSPATTSTSSSMPRQSSSIVEVTKRFVNYFVVVGRGAILKQTVVNSSSPNDVQFQPLILDSYPDALPDVPLPTHIAQFAFPEGLALSSTFREPSFFSFVLTNVSGAKLYACALKFDELLTPFEVLGLFMKETIPAWAHALSNGTKQTGASQTTTSSATSVYSPKCLVVVSHYPFFSCFRTFLQQMYRVSLSETPLPLERYIANFVAEIPVPPPGRVQVQLTLPERTLTVSRPPKNQLPQADFSFRPLFQMLDLHNVMTVALCSKHLSVLTPIAEALVALLFPLYWQGAYIPILPSSLLDVIDAPVPFLVGVHAKYLATSPSRATDVFFVDLDHNRVLPPSNELGQETIVLPKLPERESSKLKAKLIACANIFDPFAAEIAKSDMAFDKTDDYLKPLNDVGGGMTVPVQEFATSPSSSSFSSMDYVERKTSGFGMDRKSTFQTLLTFVPSQSTLTERSMSTPSSASLLQQRPPSPRAFDADAIRLAFLRFFVSIFKRYATYLNPKAATAVPGSKEVLFDRQGFLRDQSDATSRPGLTMLLSTQMFERFCEDRIVQPSQLPDVRFFDASINQKLNRSSLSLSKKADVSFLEDKTDVIRETFVSPPPSTLGLPDDGTRYKYRNGFPRLKRHLFGTIRKPRELYSSREQQRHVASAVDVHQQIYRLSTCVMEPGASWEATRKLVVRLQAITRMHQARKRYRKQRAALISIQRFVHAHFQRRACEAKYKRYRQALVTLQTRWRCRTLRREYLAQKHAIAVLQRVLRGFVYATRYCHLRHGIISLQALHRCRIQRRWFLQQKRRLVHVQSHVRGMQARQTSRRWRNTYLAELRHGLFDLWAQAAVPLVYRAKFWLSYDRVDFLSIGVHLEEMARVRALVGEAKVVPSNQSNSMDIVLTRKAKKQREKLLHAPPRHEAWLTLAQARLDEERLHLYNQLKYHTTETMLHSFYRSFELSLESKKRKRKLVELLWTCLDMATTSAEVVLAISSQQMQVNDAMETKLHSRICTDLVYTVNAAMSSLQKTTQKSSTATKKREQEDQRQLVRAMVYQNHCLEIQLAQMQRQLVEYRQIMAAASMQDPQPQDDDSSVQERRRPSFLVRTDPAYSKLV
ncbi:ARS-binding factor 1 [Aphanomyces cochlioides]|nr:ARS-binding factor 1 [Aphanomyces cochlioides]